MKFDELTKIQLGSIKKIYSDTNKQRSDKISEIMKSCGVTQRCARYWLEKKLPNPNINNKSAHKRSIREISKEDTLFITEVYTDQSKLLKDRLQVIMDRFNINEKQAYYLANKKLKLKNERGHSRFNLLTEEDKVFITKTYWDKSKGWDERMNILVDKFGVNERNIRKWCTKLKITQKGSFDAPSEQFEKAKIKDFDKTKKYFIISCAQNATDVNDSFLCNMKVYADYLKGELLIIPIRYHNPGQFMAEEDKEQEWWDNKLEPYLSSKRHKLNNKVTILSDIKIMPTAQMPLNGFESLAGDGSAILAHPRVHMKSLPVLGETPKMLFTTGICTKPNYTESRAGKIGEFHHSFGFIIVEIQDNEIYYIRQVIAKADGSFNDLYFNVSNGDITRIKSVTAIVKGDIHYGNHDNDVFEKSFNELIPKINPDKVILHDVFDGYSINHHEENNWVLNYQKSVDGKDSLTNEIDSLIKWLKTLSDLNLVIVFSNHDDFLNRFIINSNPQKLVNPQNALGYVELAKIMLENNAPNGLIAYAVNKEIPKIKCLGRNDSYIVNGWELAVHGMDGANGSKGNIQQFKKLNTHIITAHGHAVYRFDGAIQVGTNSKLRFTYNKGMSSWVHSDVIIHNDKKAQHIFYIGPNKEFTTLK